LFPPGLRDPEPAFARRDMSSPQLVHESQSELLLGNKLIDQPGRVRLLSRQVLCVVVLVVTDLSAILLSLKLGILLRANIVRPVAAPSLAPIFPLAHYMAFGWLGLVPILFLALEGLYTRRRSFWNEVGHLTKAVGMSVVALLAALALAGLAPPISRLTILLTTIITAFLLPVVRYWTKRVLRALGPWRKNILILGVTDMAMLAMRGLTSDPFLGYEVAGLLDEERTTTGQWVGNCEGTPVHILGNLLEAREQMKRTKSKDLLIALPNLPKGKLLSLIYELQPQCDSIYIVPHLWGLPMMNLQVDGFLRERVMMLKLSNDLAKPWNCWLKRGFDLLLGTAVAVFILPVCVVIAALIKLDSEGPALFDQERLGYRGGSFRCLKFRTMHVNSEEILSRHLDSDPLAAGEWQKFAKLRQFDPRLTRIGRFLRRWSLDELPQIVNVLKGEMSLVGPRPYLLRERVRMGCDIHTIVSARPGITGFWQVSGRNQLTLEERVQLEAWYVRNWTLWLDFIILARTFSAVLFPHNGSAALDVLAHSQPQFLYDEDRESLHQSQ
jgi:Undecaprenyl-phosphate galactose phosphotransferase WbaP